MDSKLMVRVLSMEEATCGGSEISSKDKMSAVDHIWWELEILKISRCLVFILPTDQDTISSSEILKTSICTISKSMLISWVNFLFKNSTEESSLNPLKNMEIVLFLVLISQISISKLQCSHSTPMLSTLGLETSLSEDWQSLTSMMLLFQNHQTRVTKSNVPKTFLLKIFTLHSPSVWPLDLLVQVLIMHALEMLHLETFRWTTQLKVFTLNQTQDIVETVLLKISYMKTFTWKLQSGGHFGSVHNNNTNQVALFKVALCSIHSVASAKLNQESPWETWHSETLPLLTLFFQQVSFSVTLPTHALTSNLRTMTLDHHYGTSLELESLTISLKVSQSTHSQIQNSSQPDTTMTQRIEFLIQSKMSPDTWKMIS